MTEQWRTYYESNLPKTHGKYVKWEISSEGNVKRNGQLYKPKIHNGYLDAGRWHVHRMVAECFIQNQNNYNEVDHINGNRQDNRFCNLQWCTHKENINNPITIKRKSKSQSEETRKLKSHLKREYYKTHDAPIKGKHRVYREDGSFYMSY